MVIFLLQSLAIHQLSAVVGGVIGKVVRSGRGGLPPSPNTHTHRPDRHSHRRKGCGGNIPRNIRSSPPQRTANTFCCEACPHECVKQSCPHPPTPPPPPFPPLFPSILTHRLSASHGAPVGSVRAHQERAEVLPRVHRGPPPRGGRQGQPPPVATSFKGWQSPPPRTARGVGGCVGPDQLPPPPHTHCSCSGPSYPGERRKF